MNQILTMHDRSDPGTVAAAAAAREAKATAEHAADEGSVWARHGDPTRRKSAALAGSATRRRSGIEWVRASDLLSATGSRVLGRGIDFQAELTRRTRALPVHAAAATRRAIRDRALHLPPASSFAHPGSSQPVPTRAGIGRR